MKKLLLPILLACAVAMPVRAQSILVIDVNGVFNGLTEVQTEIAKMKSAVDEYNSYLNDQTKVIIDMQTKVQQLQQQADNPVNTPESRETFKRQASEQAAILDSKRREIASFQQTCNNVIQQQQESLVSTQLGKIRDDVKTIAAKRHANLVVNKSNMGMISSVIYNDDTMDISTEVRDDLNKAAAAAPASTSPGPALPTPPSSSAPATTARPASSGAGR